MKKLTKPASKKPAAKQPIAKKPSAKPKRKAQSSSELVGLIERLAAITEQLAQTAERLAHIGLPAPVAQPAAAPVFETPRPDVDEHANEVEGATSREE